MKFTVQKEASKFERQDVYRIYCGNYRVAEIPYELGNMTWDDLMPILDRMLSLSVILATRATTNKNKGSDKAPLKAVNQDYSSLSLG